MHTVRKTCTFQLPHFTHDSTVPGDALHIRISVTMYNILHSAGITVGYVDTSVTVLESAGVAQLTVAISIPSQGDQIDISFFLLVNTNDGTATAGGLSSCLELHTVLTCHYVIVRH